MILLETSFLSSKNLDEVAWICCQEKMQVYKTHRSTWHFQLELCVRLFLCHVLFVSWVSWTLLVSLTSWRKDLKFWREEAEDWWMNGLKFYWQAMAAFSPELWFGCWADPWLELERNLHEVSSFIITEKRDLSWLKANTRAFSIELTPGVLPGFCS